jgi:hypothetical protein
VYSYCERGGLGGGKEKGSALGIILISRIDETLLMENLIFAERVDLFLLAQQRVFDRVKKAI